MEDFKITGVKQAIMGKRGGKISPANEFKKGQSGNPNGRPKKLPEIDELLADVLGEELGGKEAAKKILIALRKKAMAGDVRASELLLNRAYGKPKETVNQNVNAVYRIVDDTE